MDAADIFFRQHGARSDEHPSRRVFHRHSDAFQRIGRVQGDLQKTDPVFVQDIADLFCFFRSDPTQDRDQRTLFHQCFKFHLLFSLRTHECAAVDVEDLSRDKAGTHHIDARFGDLFRSFAPSEGDTRFFFRQRFRGKTF